MANTSFTTAKIFDEVKSLEEMVKLFGQVTSEKTEYDILLDLGYTEEEADNLDVRGYIDYYKLDYEKKMLEISISHKWCAPTDFLKALWDKFPKSSIYFATEESGCEIFETNDSEFEYFDRYIVLSPDSEDEYYHTFDDLQKAIIDIYGYQNNEIDTFEKLKKKVEDIDENISIYEFEVVEL